MLLVGSQAELSNREMNDSICISLQSIPLSQDIEHRNCVRQPHLKVTPNSMHDFLEMTNQSQHRKHGLNDHPHRPGLALTDLQVRGVTFSRMKATIRKHDHFLLEPPEQRLKVGVRNISGRTLPSDNQPVLVQEQAELAAYNPAPVRQPFTSILLRAASFYDRVNQLNAIGVNNAPHTCCGHESPGQMAVQAKKTKQARLSGKLGNRCFQSRQPAIKGAIANAFKANKKAKVMTSLG